MKSLTNKELYNKLAETAAISPAQAQAALDALVNLSVEYAAAEEGFTIPNLAKIQIKTQRARTMRDPRTQEIIEVPARRKLRLSIKRAAKKAVQERDLERGLTL